jgi:hypothetical protein
MKATRSEQRLARMVASVITIHRRLWQLAGRAKGGANSDWERFYEHQSNLENIIGFYICNFSGGKPARFLQLIALALDGKLGTNYEQAFLKASQKAMKRLSEEAKEMKRLGKVLPPVDVNDLRLTSEEATNAMLLVLTEMKLKKFPKETSHVRRHVLRLADKLGYKLGYKRGRPPKKKLPRALKLDSQKHRGKKPSSAIQSLPR